MDNDVVELNSFEQIAEVTQGHSVSPLLLSVIVCEWLTFILTNEIFYMMLSYIVQVNITSNRHRPLQGIA